MAITIDYSDDTTPQYIINVPKADTTLVQLTPTEVRELDINDLRLALLDLMDDPQGMAYPTSHSHVAPITVSGVDLARVLEILDPFALLFEDGLYNVNIIGGNSNVSDKTIKNQVGLNTANSAGLASLGDINTELALLRKHLRNKLTTDPTTGVASLYDDDDTTVLETAQLYEDIDGTQTYRGTGAERRERFTP